MTTTQHLCIRDKHSKWADTVKKGFNRNNTPGRGHCYTKNHITKRVQIY